jgi:hypothetical protein
MDRAARSNVQQLIDDEVKQRFPAGAVRRVAVLEYGDEPVIEPGQLLVRVFIEGAGKNKGEQALRAFEDTHGPAIKQFRHDLTTRLPEVGRLEFVIKDATRDGHRIVLVGRPRDALEASAVAGGPLTPVMARLGPMDLETLDALITAGIAANRAEAVRWALARIRERPAFEQLRERAREIERLKTEF